MHKWTAGTTMGAALAALLAAGGGSRSLAALQIEERITPRQGAATPVRPFEHERHAAVACTVCHGSGPRHGTVSVRMPRDCAACHHAAASATSCVGCHAGIRAEPERRVPATLAFTVRTAPVTRMLPFAHVRHLQGDRTLGCRDCHQAPVTLAVTRSCGSCHERHHGPGAACTSCHAQAPPGIHRASAHLGCAGSGCHAPGVAPPPSESRSLCVACHREQAGHEPQGVCASCHRVPGGRWRDAKPPPSSQGGRP